MEKSLIKLSNVSKFYYSKGVIASGFTKLSTEFNIGEFVAITGESGSGKSTLLNVISGLDTYEEGEMYINGEETSHYTDLDFENYRRKYISNIFQSFNLINSYTVYQNIELVLLLNGNSKRKIKGKVLELIDTVGLKKFKNTKVSKLSGGQKQRVAIARALAKETPIIIADEPTGNLDSKAASGIIKLLSEIAKDKLVIVVTHNYEQVEEYVTRKIKMHDGRILEDKKIKKPQEVNNIEINNFKNITFINRLRLGIRNTFNIIPKFLLVLLIYLFMSSALLLEYASLKESEYVEGNYGYNYFFTNLSQKRIIIKKEDKTYFTEEDYEKISKIDNVDYVVKNDLLLDNQIALYNDSMWLYGTVDNINNFPGEVDYGRMPENEQEVLVVASEGNYYYDELRDQVLSTMLTLEDRFGNEITKGMKVVGIKYDKDDTDYMGANFYFDSSIEEKLSYNINRGYTTLKILFENKYYESSEYTPNFQIISSYAVAPGYAYISEDYNILCDKYNCKNHGLKIEATNRYYTDELYLTVSNTYNKKNFLSLVGYSDYDERNGQVYINVDDYNRLYNKGNFQSSVFVKNDKNIEETEKALNEIGLYTLVMKDTLMRGTGVQVLRIIRTVVTIILVIVLFFISYFVLKIILKSRNVYFSTLRMIGANKKVCKRLLIIELLNAAFIAYSLMMIFLVLCFKNIIKLSAINTLMEFLCLRDYILLGIILLFISFMVAIKFAKKLFKDSAIKTIHEEV